MHTATQADQLPLVLFHNDVGQGHRPLCPVYLVRPLAARHRR